MSSPGGPSAAALAIMTQPISMPDYIEIDSPTVECDSSATVYLAWLGALKCAHTNWGTIAIKGLAKRVGPFTLVGVFGTKNSTYQQGRALRVEVSGPMTLASTDRAIYLSDEDGVATLGASVLIQGVNGGSPRFSPFSADSVQIIGGTMHSITNDKGAGLGTFATQRYTLSGVELAGGAVGIFSNIALRHCVFNGAYTNLPPVTTGTYVGCVKTAAGNVGGINNITDNVVAPFSLPPSPSATYNPPSLASGASTTTTVAATGAALGDFASASFSLDLQGIQLTAYVSAVNVVTVVLVNLTGGTIDLASGTLKVTLRKPS
ncbi:hypothetical protein D3C85_960400 [compost metagenome]